MQGGIRIAYFDSIYNITGGRKRYETFNVVVFAAAVYLELCRGPENAAHAGYCH